MEYGRDSFLSVLDQWRRESTDITVSAWLSGSDLRKGAHGALTRITGKVAEVNPTTSTCSVVARDESMFQLSFEDAELACDINLDFAAKYARALVGDSDDIEHLFSLVQPCGATICMFSLALDSRRATHARPTRPQHAHHTSAAPVLHQPLPC